MNLPFLPVRTGADVPEPIFVLGISERSGTNYLRDLLDLHAACAVTDVVFEDFLVAHSDLLASYADRVHTRWLLNPRITDEIGQPKDAIFRALGEGLLGLMYANSSQQHDRGSTRGQPGAPLRRLVTKTPTVENVTYFFRLFPNAQLIIIVRDGRAVVESGVKTFNWSYEKAMHLWSSAAHQVIDFDQHERTGHGRYTIVRFEDLHGDRTEGTLRKLFEFLNLDPTAYDYDRARNLPVKGSSALGAKATDLSGWNPVEKPKDFDPLRRYAHWGAARHARFNWVAGPYMEQLGYSIAPVDGSSLPRLPVNYVLDLGWALRSALKKVYRSLPANYQQRLAVVRQSN